MSTARYSIIPGEYSCYAMKKSDGRIFDLSTGVPSLVAGLPSPIVSGHASLHHAAFIDQNGAVYVIGDGEATGSGIAGDGATGAFTGAKKVALPLPATQVVCYNNGGNANGMGSGCAAVLSDGSVIIWGNTQGGFPGDGSAGINASLPVKVPGLPAIKKIQAGLIIRALDTTGVEWNWGGGIMQWEPPYVLAQGTATPSIYKPGKLAWSVPLVDIVGGSKVNYAIDANGDIIGWAYQPAALGLANTPGQFAPFKLTSHYNFRAPVQKIVINSMAALALLTDGSLWGWGDNMYGCCGIGTSLDPSKYGYNLPWPGDSPTLPVNTPVQIGTGLTFVDIYGGIGDVFYFYAEDINGQLYSWGRNKGGVLGNDEVCPDATQTANFPNSWDVNEITPINPWSYTSLINVMSPAAPSQMSLQSATQITPTAIMNADGKSATISVKGTNPLIAVKWSLTAGDPSAQIVIRTGQTAQIVGLKPGLYTLQVIATDQDWKQTTASVTLTVPQSGQRTVTGLKIMIDGVLTPVSLAGAQITFSDGTMQ